MSETTSTEDYSNLQSTIDRVIGRIGLKRTIFLLDSFLSNTKVAQNEKENLKLLTHYLVKEAIQVFDLSERLFYVCGETSYRDARMCCFHLLRKYTDYTFSKIGMALQFSERAAMYGNTVVEQRISLPKANPAFVSKYDLLESKLIEFISKVN